MRQPMLSAFLLLVVVLTGCGYKTDLTLPEEQARALHTSQENLLSS